MGKRGRPDWVKEQRRAEKARRRAQKLLEGKKQAWDAASEKKIRESDVRDSDNTLELIRKRKAELLSSEDAVADGKAKEDVEPFENEKSDLPASGSKADELMLDLPKGWVCEAWDVEIESEKKETKMFRHVASGCVTLTPPTQGKEADAAQKFGAVLPKGWKTIKDPESDAFYFWNAETGEIQRETPEHASLNTTEQIKGECASDITKQEAPPPPKPRISFPLKPKKTKS